MLDVLLGFLVLVGLGVAGLSLGAWRSTDSGIALGFLLTGLALAGWSGLAFWRRDPIATVKLLLFCCLMPALVLLLWIMNNPAPYGWTPWFAGAFALGATACAWYLWRDWGRVEVLPNVLLEAVGSASVFELDGLQFSGRFLSGPEGGWELHLALQSCVDAERVFTLRLSGPPSSRLCYRPQSAARLGPAEVGVLVVPIRPLAGVGSPVTLRLDPEVTGPWGARVRHWRARTFERRVDPGLRALLLLGGHLTWGGGWSLEVPPAGPQTPPDAELPPDRWEVRWQPDPALLRSAVR